MKILHDRNLIAVYESEFNSFGCPGCGSPRTEKEACNPGTALYICPITSCQTRFMVVKDGLSEPAMSYGGIKPMIIRHPKNN